MQYHIVDAQYTVYQKNIRITTNYTMQKEYKQPNLMEKLKSKTTTAKYNDQNWQIDKNKHTSSQIYQKTHSYNSPS